MPPHDCVVLNFRVMEITEVFRSRLEKTEETEVHEDGCTSLILQTDPIIHDSFVKVFLQMYVSTKKNNNKTVMGHKRNNN